MAVISAKDHLKTHNRLVEDFRKHIKRIEANQPPSEELALEIKEQAIGSLRATLSDVEKGREEVVGRYDSKISNLRGEISRLEKEVKDERNRRAGSGKKKRPPGKKGGAARSPSKEKTKGGASTAIPSVPLEEIKGIGTARAKALKKAGIADVAAFRETPADELREILGPMDYRELKTRSIAVLKAAKKKGVRSGKPSKPRR